VSQITLPGDNVLDIEPARAAFLLFPAVGGARLELRVKVAATIPNPEKAPPSCALSGLVLIGPATGNQLYDLCPVSAANLIDPTVRAVDVLLTGYVSSHQLAVVEELRQGDRLLMLLRPQAECMYAIPGPIRRTGIDVRIDLLPGEWAEQYERVDATAFIEVQVPVTGNSEQANAARRLREARSKIGKGEFEAAIQQSRLALEPVRAAYRTATVASTARPKPARERTKDERWALRVEDLFSWLSAAAHDDTESIEGCTFSYTEAVDALADVAGKVARFAHDRARGLV
jgi:hypothetical protein